jgi:hypothetical protein
MMRHALWTSMSCLTLVLLAPALVAQAPAPEQKPPILPSDLADVTYHFDVLPTGLTGAGAELLAREAGRNQFFIIGEYHGSSRISEFTQAMIPVLHDAGYRHFGLEVGPVSAAILGELSSDPAATTRKLRDFNTRYLRSRGERDFTPIPFFSTVEDAAFLAQAAMRRWSLIGLDQEFSFSHLPLIERMYRNLPAGRQSALRAQYDQAVDAFEVIYRDDAARTRNAAIAISESAAIQAFLDEASEDTPTNAAIAVALRTTTEIYRNNANTIRKYYLANDTRVQYMKANLAAGFAATRFDQTRDKMLLKMGAVHTGRGFSPLSLFEIGNTLSELAAVNGNASVHLYFMPPHYVEDGREVDALADPDGFDQRFKALLQMGRRDQWTVIDLRPLREAVFYHRRFEVDEVVRDIWKNHDLVVIPKLDPTPTPNYETRGGVTAP